MSLPEITHLQFVVMDIMGTKKTSGRELRESLKKIGIKKSGPAFYQLMSRLEESKFVEGSYEFKIVEGQQIRERRYKLKGAGATAIAQARAFYERDNQDFVKGGLHA